MTHDLPGDAALTCDTAAAGTQSCPQSGHNAVKARKDRRTAQCSTGMSRRGVTQQPLWKHILLYNAYGTRDLTIHYGSAWQEGVPKVHTWLFFKFAEHVGKAWQQSRVQSRS